MNVLVSSYAFKHFRILGKHHLLLLFHLLIIVMKELFIHMNNLLIYQYSLVKLNLILIYFIQLNQKIHLQTIQYILIFMRNYHYHIVEVYYYYFLFHFYLYNILLLYSIFHIQIIISKIVQFINVFMVNVSNILMI